MGMVARVKVMMMECSVKPVVEELHRTSMQQCYENQTVESPNGHLRCAWNYFNEYVKQDPVEYYLVIPVILFKLI